MYELILASALLSHIDQVDRYYLPVVDTIILDKFTESKISYSLFSLERGRVKGKRNSSKSFQQKRGKIVLLHTEHCTIV